MKYRLISKENKNYSPVQQILTNRGIDAKDIEHYLKTSDGDVHDPLLLGDALKIGIARLIKAIKNREKILIIVDCDADGYTSAAALINYLAKIFPSCLELISIKIHEGKEHGIEEKWLEEIIENYTLVICPDASSNDYDQHKTLADNGVDVLVLDHHEAERVSENAIVVNNQLSDYPNKTLSGVGVVYKFCSYIDTLMNQQEADKMLDLVALGMIADMMDMREFETKHLIQKGLISIQNPFFKGLVERQAYSLGDTVTPIGVAFYIAPLINATIRVGTQQEKETMLKAMLDSMAYEEIPSTKRGCKGQFETVMDQAVRNSTNIRNRQKKARDEGMAAVEKTILDNNLLDNQVILVESPAALDKNLTGLVANQLMAKYQKPVLLLRKVIGEDGNITLQGSGRGYDKSELSDFREFLLETSMFNYAEGHGNAFGAGIDYSKAETFIEYANEHLADLDFTACYDVDYVYYANDFKPQDILDIGSMKALWGKGVDESFVVIKSVKVTKSNITLMSADRNPTIKIALPNGTSIIKFGASRDEYNSLISEGFVEIDLIGTCAINEWNGMISPQILVKEYEVVTKQEYYF